MSHMSFLILQECYSSFSCLLIQRLWYCYSPCNIQHCGAKKRFIVVARLQRDQKHLWRIPLLWIVTLRGLCIWSRSHFFLILYSRFIIFKRTSSATCCTAAPCAPRLPLTLKQMNGAEHVSAFLQTSGFWNCALTPISHACSAYSILRRTVVILYFHQGAGIQGPLTARVRRRGGYRQCDDSRSVELTSCCKESPLNSVIVFTFIHHGVSVRKHILSYSIWWKQTTLSGPSSVTYMCGWETSWFQHDLLISSSPPV